MATLDLSLPGIVADLSSGNLSIQGLEMDEDDVDILDSPAEEMSSLTPDQSSLEKQRANLAVYLDALPYQCESLPAMQDKLEHIVAKLLICAESKNWSVLTTWDAMLQCWLQLRYPMATSTRAKLVRLYYELCLVPGLDIRIIRSWADMISRLLGKTGKRRLESFDLHLPWWPLWQVLYKELFPKKRLGQSNRNLNNILLYVAEVCKPYFPADDIPDMLNAFLPMVTPNTILTMIPVLTSFLPPSHPHLYLPVVFKLWEAFNSFSMDDRFLELAGNLAEEHVAGKASNFGEQGGAQWKDVGIWSEQEWTLLVSKGFESMYVPVGKSRNPNLTSAHADAASVRQGSKVKKTISRTNALAKVFVYSMAVDGPIRGDSVSVTPPSQNGQTTYLAGSKAMDTLDRLITSTESFFHPSSHGHWTMLLTSFLQRLTTEFADRWLEEQLPSCRTPVTRRLTPGIRRAFVTTLLTPALLAMFSKDSLSLAMTQGALRVMAQLEPALVMPELLERAYGGLEVVNETHRTTAVLKILSGISLPLVSEKMWRPGQKHLLPLLELCIPGIDLNDPNKTICATSFIISVIQHVKVGDISMHQSGFALSGDTPSEDLMELDNDETQLPVGVEHPFDALSREEERALVRESTSGFADWVASLFRRILALYENLPEEGGRKKTTGGKTEEAVLKSIKNMADVVCLHLSDQLFDLVLNLVYDYATTNAKSNAVRAFGHLVACLARAKPQQTVDKFLPFCILQIQDELRHGASSIRTTSTHESVPSDTTFHWNMAILRGCLGYSGPALLKHKNTVIQLLSLLLERTKSERGYSGTAALVSRVLHTLTAVYPINNHFVNSDRWVDHDFNKAHNTQWGHLYEPRDVRIEWHVPVEDEIDFVLQILDHIASPALDKLEALVSSSGRWDSIARNDFCRYMAFSKAVWNGMPTIYKEAPKEIAHSCLDSDVDVEGLIVDQLDVQAGIVLTDPQDPRYQRVAELRTRFGNLIHLAAAKLREDQGEEDHVDAVIAVVKALDTFFLDYGMTRGDFVTLQKNFSQSREVNRMSARQRDNVRAVWVKRAQLYHSTRLYTHALYRRRSVLDDQLLKDDLAEFCLSSYTRVRRLAQSVLHNICGYYVRSTRYILPTMFDSLNKGRSTNPDRMKGALYVLGNKGTTAYIMADQRLQQRYLLCLLECQQEEKPSIQKLVSTNSSDSLVHLNEEAIRTAAYSADVPGVGIAVRDLELELDAHNIDSVLRKTALTVAPIRIQRQLQEHELTLKNVLDIATSPTTHWRYVQIAITFILGLMRRDTPTPPNAMKFLMEQTTSVQPLIRLNAQQGIVRESLFIKMRTFAKNDQELWLCQWRNPFSEDIPINDHTQFLNTLRKTTLGPNDFFVDKLETGFLTWTDTIRGYTKSDSSQPTIWDPSSSQSLATISKHVDKDYYSKLAALWSQETENNTSASDLRPENVLFVKSLAKMVGDDTLQGLLDILEPLLANTDKSRQAAAAEILTGLLRGSKHWSSRGLNALWTWLVPRFDQILTQARPDTVVYWTSFLQTVLEDRDPRRNKPLVDWILSLQLDFQADSAFAVTKTLNAVVVLMDAMGVRFNPMSEKYVSLLFNNADSNYAEIRNTVASALSLIARNRWCPSYPSVSALLASCSKTDDPLGTRESMFEDRFRQIFQQLVEWKGQRLPPPRVSQSQFDKVGLTMLLWLWASFHGSEACLAFPSAIEMLPEILNMSELNDNAELQKYSSAVLQVMSGIYLPAVFAEAVLEKLVEAIQISKSWRIRLHTLPVLVMFFYRNLLMIPPTGVSKVMDVLLECLGDENVEVREMSSKTLSGIIRCSQRQNILPLKNRFISLARTVRLPPRTALNYGESMRKLHSAVLGLCALIESFPHSIESWMPPLTEVLARHATDPPPISTTIRHCASEFRKTHQDTWHKDQLSFDDDQLQSLSTMLVGTSYYA